MSNLKYWLWLTSLREPRNTEKRELLRRLGGPERLYYAEEEELALTGLGRRGVEALADKSMDAAERILERCDSLGLRILTMEDTEYPQRLKSVYDPPLLLYVQGRLPQFDDECAVAVVGTRTCTPYGELSAEKLSFAMAKQGALILSGLAKGIDAAAHRGALRAGGCTVGVIAGGHDIVYPPSSRYLYEDVAAAGAILSEYPPGTEHRGSHFPVRNRIISGLSVAALVVEAPARSGALITAHTALEQGRDVFAVPGPIDAGTFCSTLRAGSRESSACVRWSRRSTPAIRPRPRRPKAERRPGPHRRLSRSGRSGSARRTASPMTRSTSSKRSKAAPCRRMS